MNKVTLWILQLRRKEKEQAARIVIAFVGLFFRLTKKKKKIITGLIWNNSHGSCKHSMMMVLEPRRWVKHISWFLTCSHYYYNSFMWADIFTIKRATISSTTLSPYTRQLIHETFRIFSLIFLVFFILALSSAAIN